jgi:hypothetical protein
MKHQRPKQAIDRVDEDSIGDLRFSAREVRLLFDAAHGDSIAVIKLWRQNITLMPIGVELFLVSIPGEDPFEITISGDAQKEGLETTKPRAPN